MSNIRKYDSRLIDSSSFDLLSILKDNIEIINQKKSQNILLINQIDDILKKRLRDIKQEQVDNAEQIKTNYMENYSYLNEKNNIYVELKLKIEEIMQVHGSAISEMNLIGDEFGDLSFRERSSSIDSEDSFDFM